jgi:CO/xanthine dehydrogenase Mo-binding subunit
MTHWGVGGPIVGSHTLVFDQPTIDPKIAVAKGMPFTNIGVFTFAAMVSEVAIDKVTGKASAEGAWYAVDVGQAINPGLVEGQVDGGYAQGLGYALFEEMVWDDGRLANPTLMDYKAPGTAEVPYEIDTTIVEHPEPDGPFGAKGVGEITLVTVPASIANAITHASGVRLRKLPLSPERVLNGLIENENT